MDNKTVYIVVILACSVAIIVGAWYLLAPQPAYAGPEESVVVGTPPLEYSALVWIADDRGFFRDNGLNVTLKHYDAGTYAVPGMLAGETDLALASEYVLAQNALSDQAISTLASIDTFQSVAIIARKDHGIAQVADLKGKKIGVTRKSTPEFYLGRYLELHGMSIDEVTMVDLQPQQMSDALERGDIDAVVTWQPFVYQITGRMGDTVTSWPAQAEQRGYWLVIARNDWPASHPGTARRFITALRQAGDFTRAHPAEAQAVVQGRMGTDAAYVAAVWPENTFTLSLDQSLLLAMEDEARWMIANNLTPARQMPNYLDYVTTGPFSEVRPEAMRIIGAGAP
jgi:NitT/TauT family transport system substrate-binding protein